MPPGLPPGACGRWWRCTSTFLQRAYDQIIHDVCLQNLPVVFAIDRAGLVGEDGPTHHGAFDLSFLRHIPRLVVAAPKDTVELRDLLATAFKHDGPMAIRYPRGGGPIAYRPTAMNILSIGSGELISEGEDGAIIAIGSTVYPAIAAARMLREWGISAQVVNARFVKPLDEQLIGSVLDRRMPVVVVEDNSIVGGFGSAVMELASSRGVSVDTIRRLGIPDSFVEHDSPEALRDKLGMSASGIADTLRNLLEARIPSTRRGFLSSRALGGNE